MGSSILAAKINYKILIRNQYWNLRNRTANFSIYCELFPLVSELPMLYDIDQDSNRVTDTLCLNGVIPKDLLLLLYEEGFCTFNLCCTICMIYCINKML